MLSPILDDFIDPGIVPLPVGVLDPNAAPPDNSSLFLVPPVVGEALIGERDPLETDFLNFFS